MYIKRVYGQNVEFRVDLKSRKYMVFSLYILNTHQTGNVTKQTNKQSKHANAANSVLGATD